MQKISKAFFLFSLLVALWLINGCSKQNNTGQATIAGTWAATSQRLQYTAGKTIYLDTTYPIPSGYLTYTFDANGYYTKTTPGGTTGSGYFVLNKSLNVFDTTAATHYWASYSITNLTANNLAIQDTGYTGVDSAVLITLNFIR